MADATEDSLRQSQSQPRSPTPPDLRDFDHDAVSAEPSSANDESGSEAEDIAPNFLNLSLSTSSRSKAGGALPKRGLKDFEANPTLLQSRTLAASRRAMHDALSHVRVHHLHDSVVGEYEEDTGQTFVSQKRARGKMFATVGRWQKGSALPSSVNTRNNDGGWILEPEEALWALESGRLDVRYPADSSVIPNEDPTLSDDEWHSTEQDISSESYSVEKDATDFGIPMSLQGAYAAFIGDEPVRGGMLTFERYTVYSALRRSGYIVMRAEGWDGKQSRSSDHNGLLENSEPKAQSAGTWKGLFAWLYARLFAPKQETEEQSRARQRSGPLVTPGLYRSYDEIYRLLQLIPSHHPRHSHECDRQEEQVPGCSPFTTTYNVYKASPSFRKTAPGPPDFRICVISARETMLPTLSQLSWLMEEQSFSIPSPLSLSLAKVHARVQTLSTDDIRAAVRDDEGTPETSKASKHNTRATKRKELDAAFAAPNTGTVGHMYARLKQGRRNVILAIVDEGIVSYLRIADSAFAEEKLFERINPTKGGQSGGKGGRRGRERARGKGSGREG